jgi:hypothetical protein
MSEISERHVRAGANAGVLRNNDGCEFHGAALYRASTGDGSRPFDSLALAQDRPTGFMKVEYCAGREEGRVAGGFDQTQCTGTAAVWTDVSSSVKSTGPARPPGSRLTTHVTTGMAHVAPSNFSIESTRKPSGSSTSRQTTTSWGATRLMFDHDDVVLAGVRDGVENALVRLVADDDHRPERALRRQGVSGCNARHHGYFSVAEVRCPGRVPVARVQLLVRMSAELLSLAISNSLPRIRQGWCRLYPRRTGRI